MAWSASGQYLNQCWYMLNSNPRNKLQWNLKWKSYIYMQKNAFENGVCEMAAILSLPQCVSHYWPKWILSSRQVKLNLSVSKVSSKFHYEIVPWNWNALTCALTSRQWVNLTHCDPVTPQGNTDFGSALALAMSCCLIYGTVPFVLDQYFRILKMMMISKVS